MIAKAEILLFSLLAWMVLTGPLGEGGATPPALLATQTAVIAGWIVRLLLVRRCAGWSRVPRDVLGAAVGYVGIALLASLGTPYSYASFLRCLDLATLLGLFLLTLTGR